MCLKREGMGPEGERLQEEGQREESTGGGATHTALLPRPPLARAGPASPGEMARQSQRGLMERRARTGVTGRPGKKGKASE